MFLNISQNSQENNFIKKETLTQVFCCEFCEVSKNTFFTEHLWTTASGTSIPHKFGLETFDYFLTMYQEDLHLRFKKDFALESLNFIFKNNTLTFDSELYLQIKGTRNGYNFRTYLYQFNHGLS